MTDNNTKNFERDPFSKGLVASDKMELEVFLKKIRRERQINQLDGAFERINILEEKVDQILLLLQQLTK